MSSAPDVVYNLWIRMWREHDAEGGGRWEWRGRVKNALTREDRPFRKIEGLVAAITELTAASATESPRGRGS